MNATNQFPTDYSYLPTLKCLGLSIETERSWIALWSSKMIDHLVGGIRGYLYTNSGSSVFNARLNGVGNDNGRQIEANSHVALLLCRGSNSCMVTWPSAHFLLSTLDANLWIHFPKHVETAICCCHFLTAKIHSHLDLCVRKVLASSSGRDDTHICIKNRQSYVPCTALLLWSNRQKCLTV